MRWSTPSERASRSARRSCATSPIRRSRCSRRRQVEQRRGGHRRPGRRLDHQRVDARRPRRCPLARGDRLHRVPAQVPSAGLAADQATFEAMMGAVDAGLAVPRPAAQKPRAISELISTAEYLAAREACADDGRRAIELVREHAERLGVLPDTVGMVGFSAGAFLAVDVALDPRATSSRSSRRSTAARRAARRCLRMRRRSSRRSRKTTSSSRSSKGFTPTGRQQTVRRSCMCSPEAGTASAWCSKACPPTAGPTCSSLGSTTCARHRGSLTGRTEPWSTTRLPSRSSCSPSGRARPWMVGADGMTGPTNASSARVWDLGHLRERPGRPQDGGDS